MLFLQGYVKMMGDDKIACFYWREHTSDISRVALYRRGNCSGRMARDSHSRTDFQRFEFPIKTDIKTASRSFYIADFRLVVDRNQYRRYVGDRCIFKSIDYARHYAFASCHNPHRSDKFHHSPYLQKISAKFKVAEKLCYKFQL